MVKFFRSQPPVALFVEVVFALLLLIAFWVSREQIFWMNGYPATDEERPQSAAANGTVALPVQPTAGAYERLAGLMAANGEGAVANSEHDAICQELIVNGGFEDLGGWTMPITDRPGAYSDERAASGERSLKLGLDTMDTNLYSDSTALQFVDLPADADQIELRAQIWQGNSGTDADAQYLQLRAGDRTMTVFKEKVDDRIWTPVTYDLTPFRGQRVRVLFGAFNTGEAGQAVLFVDDVSIQACQAVPEAASRTGDSLVAAAELPVQLTVQVMPPAERGAGTELHLPFVQKEPAPTATPTPTEGAPSSCEELLTNGGFESNVGWITPLTNGQAHYTTERVYAGERSMLVGLPESSNNLYTDSTAYRSIQLPAGAENLTLRAQVWRSGTPGEGDFHYVWVVANGRTHQVFRDLVDAQSWQPVTYDLAPFTGQRIVLFLGTYNNGSGGKAAMYVDDVSIQRCEGAAPPATATPVPAATPTPTPPLNHAPPAEVSSPDFGTNAFLWWRPEVAHRDLQLIDEAGFGWVRQSFAWEDIEPTQGGFAWENADRVVRQVNEQGLNLLARLGTDPDLTSFWAGRPPLSLDEFVVFAGAMAQRYNCTPEAVGCIQAYQIWNEPNLAREWGGRRPNPAQYVAMLKDAYAAIKAANPNAIVISAGMAPTGTDNAIAMPDEKFYREMYRAMGGSSEDYFDMLGVHAAGFAAPPELPPAQAAANPQYGGYRFFAFRHVEDIRNIMNTYGDGDTRVAILEFGWTSDAYNPDYMWFGSGAGIDEFVKADYLVRAYEYAAEHWQPWIGIMSVLTMPNLNWLDDGNPYDEEQYWWAIMEPSQIDELRLRPAYVFLCGYFNELQDEPCRHAPGQDPDSSQ